MKLKLSAVVLCLIVFFINYSYSDEEKYAVLNVKNEKGSRFQLCCEKEIENLKKKFENDFNAKTEEYKKKTADAKKNKKKIFLKKPVKPEVKILKKGLTIDAARDFIAENFPIPNLPAKNNTVDKIHYDNETICDWDIFISLTAFALAGEPLAFVLAFDRVFMTGWICFSWR